MPLLLAGAVTWQSCQRACALRASASANGPTTDFTMHRWPFGDHGRTALDRRHGGQPQPVVRRLWFGLFPNAKPWSSREEPTAKNGIGRDCPLSAQRLFWIEGRTVTMAVTAPTSFRIRRSPRCRTIAWRHDCPQPPGRTPTCTGPPLRQPWEDVLPAALVNGSEMLFEKRESPLAMDGMATVEVFDFGPVPEPILLI